MYKIFLYSGVFYLVHMGFYVVGANLHDILTFRSSAKKKKSPPKNIRPKVSVIIPAYNEELLIEKCLDSVRKSSYKNIEVIVHNDRSTDNTSAICRAYKIKYPKFNLRLINRRSQVGKAGGVNYSIKRHAHGKLIMTLDADCLLSGDAIKNAVAYFKDQNIVGVASNVRIMSKTSLLGILQKFEHMIGYRSKKFYSLANCEFIVGGVASTYRKSTLHAVGYYDTDTQTEDIGLSMKIVANGNKKERIVYAPDVVATTGGVLTLGELIKQRYRWKLGMLQNLLKYKSLAGNNDPRFSRALTMYRVPVAFLSELLLIIEPIMLAYVIYVSITHKTYVLFLGAYLMITLYVLWTVWPDEHIDNRQKLKLTTYAPFMYFIFYIMNLVQLIAIIKLITHPGKLFNLKNVSSHWVSPKRSAEQLSV